ncbi:MAG: hypothetical protein R3C03_01870 [Pirellulaceae bacterium]
MKKLSTLRFWQLRYLSKPSGDRSLYAHIAKTKPASIIEVGLGSIERATNLIRVAQKFSELEAIKYCGIDLFEGRSEGGPRLSLKDAHRELNKTQAKIRLMPGDFCTALPRLANQLGRNDLIIVTTPLAKDSLIAGWYYVPRMLNDYGVVMLRAGESEEQPYKCLSHKQVQELADRSPNPTRRAA